MACYRRLSGLVIRSLLYRTVLDSLIAGLTTGPFEVFSGHGIGPLFIAELVWGMPLSTESIFKTVKLYIVRHNAIVAYALSQACTCSAWSWARVFQLCCAIEAGPFARSSRARRPIQIRLIAYLDRKLPQANSPKTSASNAAIGTDSTGIEVAAPTVKLVLIVG